MFTGSESFLLFAFAEVCAISLQAIQSVASNPKCRDGNGTLTPLAISHATVRPVLSS